MKIDQKNRIGQIWVSVSLVEKKDAVKLWTLFSSRKEDIKRFAIMAKINSFATCVQIQMDPIAAWCFWIFLTHKWDIKQRNTDANGVSVVVGLNYICVFVHLISMDWFKGKFTGNHRYVPMKIMELSCKFSLNPIHWSFGFMIPKWVIFSVSVGKGGWTSPADVLFILKTGTISNVNLCCYEIVFGF